MFLRLLLVVGNLLLTASIAMACMCGSTSVCDAYSEAQIVAVAKVAGFKPAKWSSSFVHEDGRNEKLIEEGQEVVLNVSRWFKGRRQSQQIKLLQPNWSCDWTFEQKHLKKDYLFYLYLNAENKNYAVVSCGRSAGIRNAGHDLAWLDGLPKSLSRTRISGRAKLNDDADTFPPAANISILAFGGQKKYELKTNKQGFYGIWDIPAGKYRITADIPENLILSWTTSVPEDWTYFWSHGDSDLTALDVTIEPGKCGGMDFMFKKK